ncbi:uncharacterized protein LOC135714997 [Ochlerotatus camptorhynchus]|uniref:uncharacterized protein LOC135714997 n=1 Tax=Ochlerotatus camptorhynchus TaxID=644619 RepID=UPI0031D29EAB
MEPEELNFGFGLFDEFAEDELHPLQMDECEDGADVARNIYLPIMDGTELHRAIKKNSRSLVDALLAAYQADFDKIRDYLVLKHQWDALDRIWLRNVNLIAIDEEQCRNCKLLEQGAPKSSDLKEAIFVVLMSPIAGEEVAVLHPNENNRLEVFRLVRTLVPNGFLSWNYSESNGSHDTFIETAASCGRNYIITRLFELGADLNLSDHNPLLPACSSLKKDTIRWLLTKHFDDFDCTQRNPHQMNAFLILMQKNNSEMMDFVMMKMISYRQKYYNETETEAFNNIFRIENKDLNNLSSLTYLRKGSMQEKIEAYIVNFKLDLSYQWENVSILVCLLCRKMALEYCREEIRRNPNLLGIKIYGEITVLHECIRLGMLDILSEMYERNPEVKQYFETDRGYGCLGEALYNKRTESTIFVLENHAGFFLSNLDKLREDVVLSKWHSSDFYETHGDLLATHFPVFATDITEGKKIEPKLYPGHDLQLAFQNLNLQFDEFSIQAKDPSQSLSVIKGINDITLLHYAVDKDNATLFGNLLEAGCDMDVIDNEGNHAIHYVRSIEMLNLITEKHPEGRSLVHRTNFEGYSLLHKVFSLGIDQKNLIVLLEKVIEFGANVNQLTNNGESVVFFTGSCLVLDVLRKYNVNLEVVNNAGESALDRHLRYKNTCMSTELLSLLHKRPFFKEHAHKCLDPFMYLNRDFFSCGYQPFLEKNPETTKLIFDSVYKKSREEASRLFCKACSSAHIFITGRFLEFDYDLNYNYQDEYGYTPIVGLFSYMEESNAHLVRQLLKKGVDLEIRNQAGRNALLTLAHRFRTARWYGHNVGSVQLLLDHGARIDSTDEDGNTALHYAFKEYEWELVELLVKNGADLSAKNKDGKIPLHMAGRMNEQLFKFMH